MHGTISEDEDVKLHETENPWKPRFRVKDGAGQRTETEELYAAMRGILSKLTPQKFEKLVPQVLKLPIDTMEKLRGVANLVFDKALDEPRFLVAYAELCNCLNNQNICRQAQEREDSRNSFRKFLLKRCQDEFEKITAAEPGFPEKLNEFEGETLEERKKELVLLMDKDERRMRRKSVLVTRFIGKLYKLGMINQHIIVSCIRKLLDAGDEQSLECLCNLITTIGKVLEEALEKKSGGSNPSSLNNFFGRMKSIVNERKTSSRVRFMLQDAIDLRNNKWIPWRVEYNPQKIEQIVMEAEMEAHQQCQQSAAYSPMPSHGSMSGLGGSKNDRGKSRNPSKSVKFNEMQCPYTWDECSSKFDEIDWVQYLLTKLSKPDCNIWRLYSLKVLLGCIYGHMNNEKKAKETFESCEKLVDENSSEEFFEDIAEGMHHVIITSKYHMNIYTGKKEMAEGISSSIKPFENLSKESQAAVCATKAYILREFGYDGLEQSLKFSKLAIELDPDEYGSRQGAWYYLTGKILAELRRARSPNEMPSKEELNMLERSNKINPFPIHAVVLADSYRFAAKFLTKMSINKNAAIIITTRKTSLKIYEEAMKGSDLTVSILLRCGMGLMKLPTNFRKVELAEKALQMAYHIYPEDSSVLCGMGFLELWHKNDNNAALAYFEQSYKNGNQVAGLHMILARHRLDNTYNPLNDCNECIKKLQTKLKSRISLDEMVSYMVIKGDYYYHLQKDLLKAAREWEQAIDTLPDSSHLLESSSIFSSHNILDVQSSIYKILTDSIEEELRTKMLDMEDKKYLEGLLRKCEEKTLETACSANAIYS